MVIQDIMDTPNPDAKRFVLGMVVIPSFEHIHATFDDNTTEHPLANTLLDVPGVSEVYIQGNWITVTRQENQPWDALLREVASHLRDYQQERDFSEEDDTESIPGSEDPRFVLIRDVLDQGVMPYLNSHGGSLQILALHGDTLKVRYRGSCSGCPASLTGTLTGIEAILRKTVDPALRLEAV